MKLRPIYKISIKFFISLMYLSLKLLNPVYASNLQSSATNDTTQSVASTPTVIVKDLPHNLLIASNNQGQVFLENAEETGLVLSRNNNEYQLQPSKSSVTTPGLGKTIIAVNGVVLEVGQVSQNNQQSVDGKTIKLSVPESYTVDVQNHSGSFATQGTIKTIQYRGSGQLNLDEVNNLNLKLRGNSRVTVERVRKLDVTAAGNSKLIVTSGPVNLANIKLQGNSRLQFDSSIESLSAEVGGNGLIAAYSVHNIANLGISANGRVKIDNPKQTFSRASH